MTRIMDDRDRDPASVRNGLFTLTLRQTHPFVHGQDAKQTIGQKVDELLVSQQGLGDVTKLEIDLAPQP